MSFLNKKFKQMFKTNVFYTIFTASKLFDDELKNNRL